MELAREPPRCILAVEVGPAGRADEERVAGQDEPGIRPTGAVPDQVADAVLGVAGGVEATDVVVAELNLVAVSKVDVREVNFGRLVEVDLCSRAPGELESAREVVGLDVGLEDVADASAGRFGQPQVVVDVLDVWVADRELLPARSAEEVACAARGGMKDLSEDHSSLPFRSRLAGRGLASPESRS